MLAFVAGSERGGHHAHDQAGGSTAAMADMQPVGDVRVTARCRRAGGSGMAKLSRSSPPARVARLPAACQRGSPTAEIRLAARTACTTSLNAWAETVAKRRAFAARRFVIRQA